MARCRREPEGHAARRGSRRTHAALTDTRRSRCCRCGKPLIVCHLEALARAGMQRRGRESFLARGADPRGTGRWQRLRRAHPLQRGGARPRNRRRHFQACCRCLGPAPFLVVNGDTLTDIDFSRALTPRRRRRRAPGAGAQSAATSAAATSAWRATSWWTGRPTADLQRHRDVSARRCSPAARRGSFRCCRC